MREVTKLALRAVLMFGVSIWLMLTVHGASVGAAVSLLWVMTANDVAMILRLRREQPRDDTSRLSEHLPAEQDLGGSNAIRLFNWLNTNKYALGLCSVIILTVAGLEVYEFWRTHKLMYLGFAVFMVALVVNTWVQVYRHRGDPTWPRKIALVPRNHE